MHEDRADLEGLSQPSTEQSGDSEGVRVHEGPASQEWAS